MLHLAKVQKNTGSGKMELQLLAHQEDEHTWSVGDTELLVVPDDETVETSVFSEAMLVLVEIGDNQQIINIQEAQDWVLTLVAQNSPSKSHSVNLLREEEEKVEQWRQELTLKSQDLTRHNLEIATRQEQIQELEENLKREKEELEREKEELEREKEELEREKRNLSD